MGPTVADDTTDAGENTSQPTDYEICLQPYQIWPCYISWTGISCLLLILLLLFFNILWRYCSYYYSLIFFEACFDDKSPSVEILVDSLKLTIACWVSILPQFQGFSIDMIVGWLLESLSFFREGVSFLVFFCCFCFFLGFILPCGCVFVLFASCFYFLFFWLLDGLLVSCQYISLVPLSSS